jgi:Zn-dependent peptidase ImmA (M78 family)/DNA-binding XRE family transcriptional regulator
MNIGENIKRIRIIKRKTQSDISELAGLSRLGFSNIENGISSPSTNTLLNIAKALEVNIQDLVREPQKISSLRYRIKKINTKKDKSIMIYDEIALKNWLTNFIFLENALKDYVEYSLNEINQQNPILAALETRRKLSISDNEPIFDIISLLESAGIKIYLYKSPLKKSFGMSINSNDGAYVVAVNVKPEINTEKQIFTAAHELGHLILHSASFNSEEVEENEVEEREADIFASHFLMPNELFIKKFDETEGKYWVDRVLHTKMFFKVSYLTVLKRLIENGKVDEAIYPRFYIDYKARYKEDLKGFKEPFAINEPLNLNKNDFNADRFNRLVKKAYDRDLITATKAGEMLGLSVEDFRDLSNSWNIF